MLYAVGRMPNRYGNVHKSYYVYNTITGNTFTIYGGILAKMMKAGIPIANMHIEGGYEMLHEWPIKLQIARANDDITKHGGFVLIKHLGIDKNLLVSGVGKQITVTDNELKMYISEGLVANCSVRNVNGKPYYESIDTDKYNYNVDDTFRTEISDSYKNFVTKAAAIGLDLRFTYDLLGTEVIYTKYIGTSKEVIVPGFVTMIAEDSMAWARIANLVITNGTKFIEAGAFYLAKIEEMTVAKSVKFIGRDNFSEEGPLYHDSHYDYSKLHLECKQTIIEG